MPCCPTACGCHCCARFRSRSRRTRRPRTYRASGRRSSFVIPAKAGIPLLSAPLIEGSGTPAFGGVTSKGSVEEKQPRAVDQECADGGRDSPHRQLKRRQLDSERSQRALDEEDRRNSEENVFAEEDPDIVCRSR